MNITAVTNVVTEQLFTPEVILELGSRDGKQALQFHRAYPDAKLFTFECNPLCAKLVLLNIKRQANMMLVPVAVNDRDGMASFYPVIPEVGKPPRRGSGSLYKFDPAACKWPQSEIQVPCRRLDTWAKEYNISRVDIVWSDLQGAEYPAFMGMGDLLNTVRVVHAEVMFRPIYQGQKLMADMEALMTARGFTLHAVYAHDKYVGDALWIRK